MKGKETLLLLLYNLKKENQFDKQYNKMITFVKFICTITFKNRCWYELKKKKKERKLHPNELKSGNY